MKKGIEILLVDLAFTSCPSEYNLTDVNREKEACSNGCVFGYLDEESVEKCKDCWEKAIELEYVESEEN